MHEAAVAQERHAGLEGVDADQPQPALLVVHRKAMRLEREQEAVHGGGGKARTLREVGQRQPVSFRDQPQ
jgi:hypothetical protein